MRSHEDWKYIFNLMFDQCCSSAGFTAIFLLPLQTMNINILYLPPHLLHSLSCGVICSAGSIGPPAHLHACPPARPPACTPAWPLSYMEPRHLFKISLRLFIIVHTSAVRIFPFHLLSTFGSLPPRRAALCFFPELSKILSTFSVSKVRLPGVKSGSENGPKVD